MAPLTVTATPWPYFTVAPRIQFMDFHLDFGMRNNKTGRQVPDDFPEHLHAPSLRVAETISVSPQGPSKMPGEKESDRVPSSF